MTNAEMTAGESLPRTPHVTIAGAGEAGRVVRVIPCRMDSLADGDLFVGPDYFTASGPTVYEVTTSCAEHERGWLEVRDLTMTDAQAAARLAEPGGVEPGCDPRDGVFCYSPVRRAELAAQVRGEGVGGVPVEPAPSAVVAAG